MVFLSTHTFSYRLKNLRKTTQLSKTVDYYRARKDDWRAGDFARIYSEIFAGKGLEVSALFFYTNWKFFAKF
jgi:hypothetical protein